MRDQLINDLFCHLEKLGKVTMGTPTTTEDGAFEVLPLPLDLKRLLQWKWPVKAGEVGPYYLYSVNEVLSNDDLSDFLEANMLPIGFANNGDPLVVKYSSDDHEVGLISHDEYWEDRTVGPEQSYVTIAGSLDEMLWRTVEGRFLPIDFYSAAELAELKSNID